VDAGLRGTMGEVGASMWKFPTGSQGNETELQVRKHIRILSVIDTALPHEHGRLSQCSFENVIMVYML